MATQGSTAITGFPQDIEQRIAAAEFTVGACTMVRISAMLNESSTPNDHQWRAAIYDGNDLVAQSSIRQDVGTTPSVIDFAMTTVLSAGTYRFCLLADNAAGSAQIGGDFSGSAGLFYTDDNVFGAPTYPDPADLVDADPVRYAIEIEYNEGGSAITGTGAATSPAATASGTAVRGSTDVGGAIALTGPVPTISGTGTVAVPGDAITGTGAITSSRATLSGVGVRGITGTGALTSPMPTISGTNIPLATGGGDSRDRRRRGFFIPIYGRG